MTWTAPRTWVAGEKPPAATLNVHIRDNFKAIGDAWTSYTPTVSNWTVVNGTLSGRYMQAGKLVHFAIKYVVGSSDTKSGNLTFDLPVNAAGPAGDGAPFALPIGQAGLADVSSAARHYRYIVMNGTDQFVIRDQAGTNVDNVTPFTFATGDIVEISGTYEAA